MYRIVLCDDDNKILCDITEKIKTSMQAKDIPAEYICMSDSRKLMDFLAQEKVDVLFLDIDMPYFTGMDIAGYINEKESNTILIFVTSHDALVYQTFAYRPFGFIRKTHMDDEIDELTDRIKQELFRRKQELVVSKGQELIRVRIKDIVYIESEGNYLNIYTDQDVIKIRETMTNIEQELSQKGFLRCHKGYLVNADDIEKLRSTEIEIQYKAEKRILPVGRSYEKEVKKKLLELMRN